MRNKKTYLSHRERCSRTHPPGWEIYRKVGSPPPPLIFQFPEGGFKFQFPEDEETGLMYSNDDSIGGGDESLSALSTKLGRKSASKAKDVAFLQIFGVKNRILDQILEKFALRNGLSMGVLLESENNDDLQKRIKDPL